MRGALEPVRRGAQAKFSRKNRGRKKGKFSYLEPRHAGENEKGGGRERGKKIRRKPQSSKGSSAGVGAE